MNICYFKLAGNSHKPNKQLIFHECAKAQKILWDKLSFKNVSVAFRF